MTAIWAFDAETIPATGEPFLFAFVSSRSTRFFDTARDARAFVRQLPKGSRVWAHNLEHDLVCLYGEEEIATLSEIRFSGRAVIGARDGGVRFYDTYRHFDVKLEELGRMFGRRKLRMPRKPYARARDVWRRYCREDAAITFEAARFLARTYAEHGVEPRTTKASSALTIWRKHYYDGPLMLPPAEVYEAAWSAYAGGRSECFAIGDFDRIAKIDAASMYPWAMIQEPFPIPWVQCHEVGKDAEVDPVGLYYVRIRSELEVPILPYRSKDRGLCFPNGGWRGWYVGSELLLFAEFGGRYRVLRGYVSPLEVRPFDAYIDRMYKLKERARSKPLRGFYKVLLNGLYGKMSQRGENTRAVPLDRFERMKRKPAKDVPVRVWAGLAIWNEDGTPPPWGNMVWGAIITARARERLYREMMRVRAQGGRVLYVDTDSVIFSGPGPVYPRAGCPPGGFKLEGRFSAMMIRGKKEYALKVGRGWHAFAKGVPELERLRYLREGVAEFFRPVRFIEGTRSGEKINSWKPVRKFRRVSYEERARRRDGTLESLRVEEPGGLPARRT